MLETILVVGLVVVFVVGITQYKKRNTSTNTSGSNGTSLPPSPSEIPPRHDDGSVTPPSTPAEE